MLQAYFFSIAQKWNLGNKGAVNSMRNEDIPVKLTCDTIHHTENITFSSPFPMNSFLRTISRFVYERRGYTTPENGNLALERDILGRWAVSFGDHCYHSGTLHEDMWECVLSRSFPIRKLMPKRILILGLGAGCVAHVLKKLLGSFPSITALEWDHTMIRLAHFYYTDAFRRRSLSSRFFLPPSIDTLPLILQSENISILHTDAHAYLAETSDTYDLIIEELFTSNAQSQSVTSGEFARHVKKCVAPEGSILVNTFPSYEEVLNCWEKEWELIKPIHYRGMLNRLLHMRPL